MVNKNPTVENKQLRSFGFIVGGIFLIIGAWPVLFWGESIRIWAVLVSGMLLVLALVFPTSLKTVYHIWMRIGAGLGWVNTRIILAIGFFFVFSPMGIVIRLFGKDLLHRKLNPTVPTYGVPRSSRPGLHMKRQF